MCGTQFPKNRPKVPQEVFGWLGKQEAGRKKMGSPCPVDLLTRKQQYQQMALGQKRIFPSSGRKQLLSLHLFLSLFLGGEATPAFLTHRPLSKG